MLVVAGTHGNEINAPWLIQNWSHNPNLINNHGIRSLSVIGNPQALDKGCRYLDRDLNRCFRNDLLDSPDSLDAEVIRARELLSLFGPMGEDPCQIVVDLHSTTSAMGSCLVVYGRRPSDLALAALIQSFLGLPIYLHEGDKKEYGFLVESWPCGLVFEIGPVPQSLLNAGIIKKTRLALEACFEVIAKFQLGFIDFPDHLIVHRHLGSLDVPRDSNGRQIGFVHEELQGSDWLPIKEGDPLFLISNGEVERYQGEDSFVPVFINESAYLEKKIAMSITKREVWPFLKPWELSLKDLLKVSSP